MTTQSDEPAVTVNPVLRTSKRKRVVVSVVTGLVVIVLGALVVVADGFARTAAEDVVEQEIVGRLPAGAGQITAEIGGFAFIPQLFAGHLEELTMNFSLGAEDLPALAGETSIPLAIHDSTITHDGSVSLLGFPIEYTVTLEPSVDNGTLVLVPADISASTGAASLDVGKLIDLETLTVRMCTARYLPVSMTLTGVDVTDSVIRFEVTGRDVPLDISQLQERGTCP